MRGGRERALQAYKSLQPATSDLKFIYLLPLQTGAVAGVYVTVPLGADEEDQWGCCGRTLKEGIGVELSSVFVIGVCGGGFLEHLLDPLRCRHR